MRILGVAGSLSPRSANVALIERAASVAPDGVDVLIFQRLGELPPFDPELDAPAVVDAWRRAIASSEALLVASPEYGHSLPGVLKNAIDWVIGTGELVRKVIAITASVPARERGRLGLAALRQTLGAVRATIVGGEPIERGAGCDASLRALIEELVITARDEPRPPHAAGEHASFLRRAIELACANVRAGGRPYGSVVVRGAEIVAEGVNELHRRADPSAHAEMLALRAAAEKLGRVTLDDCSVYASGQPCPMCLAAIHLAGVASVYFGYSNEDGEPYGFTTAPLYQQLALPLEAQRVRIVQLDPSVWPESPFALAAGGAA